MATYNFSDRALLRLQKIEISTTLTPGQIIDICPLNSNEWAEVEIHKWKMPTSSPTDYPVYIDMGIRADNDTGAITLHNRLAPIIEPDELNVGSKVNKEFGFNQYFSESDYDGTATLKQKSGPYSKQWPLRFTLYGKLWNPGITKHSIFVVNPNGAVSISQLTNVYGIARVFKAV